MSETWTGALDPASFTGPVAAEARRLAAAAKAGRWDQVFTVLAENPGHLTPNVWRPGGSSLYTPLHQAAWHGAPVDVAQRLIDLGAWRSLRTAKRQRALDIAAEKGHHHLLAVLEPALHRHLDARTLLRLDEQLADLIESRIRPQVTAPLRHPSCEVLAEIPDGTLWYPVPGMYGGFSIELREHHLYVESWSRVVEGSGQAHVVTADGWTLVHQGFA